MGQRTKRVGRDDRNQAGQGLVEFTLVVPFVFVLLMGLLEIALATNASLAVTRASQNGAHVAASAGNLVGADCRILSSIEHECPVIWTPAGLAEGDLRVIG